MLSKKIIYSIIMMMFAISLQAQSGAGLTFEDSGLEEVKEQAAQEDKLIFIYGHTSWCVPCVVLEDTVFTKPQLSRLFEEHFISLSYDMGEGDGEELAEFYEVENYPVFLFLDSAGQVVLKTTGFLNSEELISIGQQILNPGNRWNMMQARYEEGARDSALLYDYGMALIQGGGGEERRKEVAAEYLSKTDNWEARRNMIFVANAMDEYGDKYYDHIVEYRYLYIKEFGESAVDNGLILPAMKNYLVKNDTVQPTDIEEEVKQIMPSRKEERAYDELRMEYYLTKGEEEKYVEIAREMIRKYDIEDPLTLNNLAWSFYENVESPKALKTALKWAKKSVRADRKYYNLDTLAALYFKMGDRDRGLKYAGRAIEEAQDTGQDYSTTLKLLEEMGAEVSL